MSTENHRRLPAPLSRKVPGAPESKMSAPTPIALFGFAAAQYPRDSNMLSRMAWVRRATQDMHEMNLDSGGGSAIR
eukprot:7380120-Prymnesium_polylepis.1